MNAAPSVHDITGLAVCVDCAAVIANADWGWIDQYPESERGARETDVQNGLDDNANGYWVLTCGGDDESGCDAFSPNPCDCCKSRLAGARHAAAILDAVTR